MNIQKRDGSIVAFDIKKIENAIDKAFTAIEKEPLDFITELIALRAVSKLDSKAEVWKLEDIQDAVEFALIESGFGDVAKAYIVYRQARSDRRDGKTVVDYKKIIEQYVDAEDWRVKENSTVNYSVGGLILNEAGALSANYWLSEVYDKEIEEAHKNADMHIHDLSMLAPYCFTGDTVVRSLDGKNRTFEELVKDGVKELWVYAYDHKNTCIVPARAINPRVTRKTNKLVCVKFTGNVEFTCTPDHLIMLRDGSYVKAEDLKINTFVMSLHVSERAMSPMGPAYNHCVKSVEQIVLDNEVEVYDLTVPGYENFAVAGGVFVHNCAGWSLKQLIREGLGGVPGKIASKPATHLSTLCNQMVNFLGIMQNEWAGAQAFSSFDTYLAPFVKKDNLSFKQVKQCIQSFIFGVNTPSRWGCVKETTKVMTPSGWKGYNELKEGDLIYTWKDGKLSTARINHVIVKEHKGKLLSFENEHYGYNQTVTGYHRMIVIKSNSNKPVIMTADEVEANWYSAAWSLPACFDGSDNEGVDFTDDEIKLAAMIYTDGSIEIRNGAVHKVKYTKSLNRFHSSKVYGVFKNLGLNNNPKTVVSKLTGNTNLVWTFYGDQARRIVEIVGSKYSINPVFYKMNERQAEIFLKTWIDHDGNSLKKEAQCDSMEIVDSLLLINALAGRISHYKPKTLESGAVVNYVKTTQVNSVRFDISKTNYSGIVWCPNTDDGTAIFKSEEGSVFISGNCQAPFSNITLDWSVPEDLKNVPAIIGGVDQDFTYGDCKAEMDMVNKAFIEIMLEGDANGRGFQYPIPTYSITKNFDWSENENNRLLFEMAAKYGTPYFSNYVNSEMDPSDIRSMCPLHPSEKVLVSTDYNPEWHVSTIDSLEKSIEKGREYNVVLNGNIKRAKLHRFDNLPGFRRVTLVNGTSVVLSNNHQNLTLEGVKTTDQLTTEDYLPFNMSVLEGQGHDFEDGYIVGAFLGDGSLKDKRSVVFSLNYASKANVCNKIKTIIKEKWGAKTNENLLTSSLSGEKSCVNVIFHSANLRGLIEDFVEGDGTEKHLHMRALSMSSEFRRGIISGYMDTDGSNNNRIYTASLKMVESFKTLVASLGKTLNVSIDYRDSLETLSDNPIYCMRIYDLTASAYKDIYKVENGYAWFKVKDIETVKGSLGFCFEVLNDEEPYFMLPSGLVTHNCRLRLDLRELRHKNGGFFGSGDSTGSVGVVTINMPRIGYLSTSKEDFYERLDKIMNIAARSLKLKRTRLEKYLEKGLYPYTKRYLGTLNNHFSTIGLVGMNEACLNAKWLGKDMSDPEAQRFAEEVLDHMRERLADYQEMYPGDLYNLEATPAESTAYRLAMHDKKHYPDIITSGSEENPYYTNSTNLPVGFTDDIWEALDVQDRLQTKYTSGTVFHAFLGQRLTDYRAAMKLVRTICANYKLPYISLSPTYSICPDHGYLAGEEWSCPHCGKKTEVYSRITGYYRPVAAWNSGKTEEFKDRKEYVPNGIPDIKKDIIDGNKTSSVEITPDFCEVKKDIIGGNTLLFTTKTCPNCPTAKRQLSSAGIEYTPVDAEEESGLTEKYGIQSVPTLVVDGQTISGLGPIIGWIRDHKD